MFLLNPQYFMYFIAFSGIIFLILYFWRKIANLECYNCILEKRLNTLKKENKDLKDKRTKPDISLDEADIIMNKIFTEDIDCCFGDKCIINDTKMNEADVTNVTITNISDTISQPEMTTIELPVANHDNTLDEILDDIDISDAKYIKDIDIESVSDINGGGQYSKKKLSKLNVDKLKEICISMNLSTDGIKNVLIDRIMQQ